jgi:hypothetical protein
MEEEKNSMPKILRLWVDRERERWKVSLEEGPSPSIKSLSLEQHWVYNVYIEYAFGFSSSQMNRRWAG